MEALMTYWTDDRSLDMEQRRLDAAQAEAKKKDGRSRARTIVCRECGEKCTVHSHKALFCSLACAKKFNARRDSRARTMYDIVMAGRFERSKNKGYLTILSQLAREARDEDLKERDGRKSWYDTASRL
jgi:hypothetical protein